MTRVRNLPTTLTLAAVVSCKRGRGAKAATYQKLAHLTSRAQFRNIVQNQALLRIRSAKIAPPALVTLKVGSTSGIEGSMATQQQRRIVETPTEARQAERGPSVLSLLVVSTGLAVLILGVVWFVFFRT